MEVMAMNDSGRRLLACPFCGGEPVELYVAGRLIVKCASCGVTTSAATDDAREAWNRRTREGADDAE